MSFTDEQKLIGKAASESYNLTVCAVAGSGKTTTCSHIISLIPNKKVLLILYNKDLAKETKRKLKNFNNTEVKTLHSFVQTKYGLDCSDDRGLIKLCQKDTNKAREPFDLIIIDEAQDLTPLMYDSIKIIIQDFNIKQIILLGDLKQCIYGFRGADPKYLEHAEKYFDCQDKTQTEWQHLSLSVSFRCPGEITSLIRKVSKINMTSAKSGGIVEFYTSSVIGKYPPATELVISKINDFLDEGNYLDQIAILAYSCRHGNNPLTKLANSLTRRGFPIYFPDHEDREPNDRLTRGKIVISTFHGFKGRERKLIILYGIDEYLERYMDLNECPNVLYVALTRCTERLLVINHILNNSPKFLAPVFKHVASSEAILKFKMAMPEIWNVSMLSKKLSFEVIMKLEQYFTVETINEPTEKSFSRIISFDYLYEDTSSMTGELITLYYRYLMEPDLTLYYLLGKNQSIYEKSHQKRIMEDSITLSEEYYDSGEYLKFLAVSVNMDQSRDAVFQLAQIKHYDWVPKNKIKKALQYLPTGNLHFEVPLRLDYLENTLRGYADIIKDDIIYEIKFTSSLRSDHQIQLLLYMCMSDNYNPGKLINAMTGEILELTIQKNCKEKIIETCFSYLASIY